jgi:hypothetical protein
MYMLNYTLDNFSLLALTLAVGFVVDDAIVMLENIVRHLDMGKTPLQASLDGSAEVAFTIVSMTVSLVAVFIPVMFLKGIVGRLLLEFAVTISVAIIVSGLVSVTLTPMLCALYLKGGHGASSGKKPGLLFRITEAGFRSDDGCLCNDTSLDAADTVHRPADFVWVHWTDCVLPGGVAEGLPAFGRYEPTLLHHRRAGGYFVLRHAGSTIAGGGDRSWAG